MSGCCAELTHQNLASFDGETIVPVGSASKVNLGDSCAFDVSARILMCDAMDQAGGSLTISRQIIKTPLGRIEIDSSNSYASQTAALDEARLRLCAKLQAVPAGSVFSCMATTQTSLATR